MYHCVLGTILRAFQTWIHLSLITTLWNLFYNYPHFVDEKTEAQRCYENFPKSQLKSGGAGIWTHSPGLASTFWPTSCLLFVNSGGKCFWISVIKKAIVLNRWFSYEFQTLIVITRSHALSTEPLEKLSSIKPAFKRPSHPPYKMWGFCRPILLFTGTNLQHPISFQAMVMVGGAPLHCPTQKPHFPFFTSANPCPDQASVISPSADLLHPPSGAQRLEHSSDPERPTQAHRRDGGEGGWQGRGAGTGRESGRQMSWPVGRIC